MPVSYKLKLAEADVQGNWARVDEWEIDYDNIRRFVAARWMNATQLYKLSKADQNLVKNIKSHKALQGYLKEAATSAANVSELAAIQSIIQIHRPLSNFRNIVERFVESEDVDTSSIWAMTYLNIKLSIESPDKLRRTTKWLRDLRRKVELFNRYIAQSIDEESMGTEMSEIFNPLLGILHDSIVYLQRHYTDDEFIKYWSSGMEPKITEYLDTMEDSIRHLNSIGSANTVNRTQAGNYLELELRDRDVVKERAGKAVFPAGNLPAFRTEIFIGRNQEIENINKQLSPPEAHRLQTYLIYGRQGVGKTQIALEYARRYREDYDAIFWIQGETNASLRTSFSGIAIALGLDGADKNAHFEESLTNVLKWLKWTKKCWLLIYDNVEPGQLLKAYWPTGARGSILLTSRSFYGFFEDDQLNGESISLFNEEESWELLMAYLGPNWQANHFAETNMMVDVEIAAAKTLLNQTRGLPLAIVHAAKLVNNENIARYTGDTSVRGFLDLFRATYSTLSERQTSRDESLFRSLNTIWSIAFKALSPNARAILGVLALLSPDEILVDLFFPNYQARLIGKLEFCRTCTETFVNATPSKTILSPPPSDFLEAIDELNRGAFISKIGRHMQIHREVQEAVNSHLLKDLKDSFDAAVNLVYEAFPKQEAGRPFSDQWDSCQRWIQHAIHLANKYWIYKQGRSGEENLLEELPSADLLVELFANCAWYLFEIADYSECLNVIEIASSTSKDKTSLAYAHLLTTEAAAYYELNQLGPSRKAIEAAIEIRQQKLPQNDPEVAIALANLGNVEAATGNFEKALTCFEQAAAIREHTGETASTMLGLNYLQIGRVYFLQGDYSRAYELYQKSESIFDKQAGRNRHYTADLQYAYGNLEFAKGEFSAATRSYELCRRIITDYKPLHPLTSAACYKLACVAFEQGNPRKALYLLDKALEIAYIRSSGRVDGTCARIQWKRAEILLDDTLATRKEEGRRLKRDIELRQAEVAEDLGVDLRLDEVAEGKDREKTFDLLVPGYFR